MSNRSEHQFPAITLEKVMKKILIAIAALMIIPGMSFASKSDKAHIITQNQKPSQCIARVAVTDIDGQLRSVSKQGFSLEPGEHSLKARALIDRSGCPEVSSNKSYAVPPLEADFEAGKTYWVGMDHSSRNKRDWKLVIWKVED